MNLTRTGDLLFTFCLIFIGFFVLVPKEFLINLVGLRIEDIFGALVSLYVFFRRWDQTSSRLFFSYALYLLYVLIHALFTATFVAQSLVILAKYFSYVCFFLLFYDAQKNSLHYDSPRAVLNGILFFPALYGVYQVISGNFLGLYGVTYPGHSYSPLSGAAMYFFCALLVDILLKRKWGVLHTVFIFLALLGGSKTVAMMVLVYCFFTTKLKILIPVFTVLFLIFYAVVQLGTEAHSLHRYNAFLAPANALIERGIWHKLPDYDLERYALAFGKGLEYGHLLEGEFIFTMAFDNLYLYLISKDGIVGSGLFLFLVSSIVYVTRKITPNDRRTANSILIGLLIAGLGAETFFLSVPALILWICLGVLVGRNVTLPKVERFVSMNQRLRDAKIVKSSCHTIRS